MIRVSEDQRAAVTKHLRHWQDCVPDEKETRIVLCDSSLSVHLHRLAREDADAAKKWLRNNVRISTLVDAVEKRDTQPVLEKVKRIAKE